MTELVRGSLSDTVVPRETAAPHPGGPAFRDAMSRVGAAVHIVTTDGPAGIAGLTATAVTAVSDDPPALLVCVHRGSRSAAKFLDNRVFCVNTLASGQSSIADVFAGRTGIHLRERFQAGQWMTRDSGAPVLAEALAAFDCRVFDVRDVATHHVIFGRVVSLEIARDAAGLFYWQRTYRAIGESS
jgi:flavin reductase